jgi:hypothetical protein
MARRLLDMILDHFLPTEEEMAASLREFLDQQENS